MKAFKRWGALSLLAAMAVSIAYATTVSLVRYTNRGNQIFDLQPTGLHLAVSLKMGDNTTATAVTLPTTTTASNYSRWLPVKLVGSSAVTQGDLLCVSSLGTPYVTVCPATAGLTTVAGVAAEAIALQTTGWMVSRGGGYAVMHTTGTVNIGDILTSTSSAAGYATGNNTPATGSAFATAMSSGAAGGGSIVALFH